jgi:hypothetical protein
MTVAVTRNVIRTIRTILHTDITDLRRKRWRVAPTGSSCQAARIGIPRTRSTRRTRQSRACRR